MNGILERFIDHTIESNAMEFGTVEGWLWISSSVHEGRRTVTIIRPHLHVNLRFKSG